MVFMKKLLDKLNEVFSEAFEQAGYDKSFGKVVISNRPDLCEYQCNGAMAAAKQYKKAPFMIADDVVAALKDRNEFAKIESVKPGFINFDLDGEYLASYVDEMRMDEMYGCNKNEYSDKVIIDYGGANVAKPLHVGHLRSAVIGESIKRILQFTGNDVVGDVHLGDWGLQMGLIITELKERKPDLVYFDENYKGEYPKEAPFTIAELEEIYPCANAKSKEDEDFKEKARQATYELQNGNAGYHAIWQHIINVSVTDLKKNYDNLNVHFELWKKESDAQKYIPDMVQYMKDNNYTRISEGALVVDVVEETDTKEMPPCMILKSNGATLYNTTDLATIIERMKLFDPNHIIYVVDKRQELYFTQVFRCARKTKLVNEDTKLTFLGFGTMNGKDGKPFKTRDGGVMRLENLIKEINDAVYDKIMENRDVSEEEARETAKIVGLSALKYGDLSNQASKDYIFDIDRFTSFEGNTGPYILYTIVRIKSILNKFYETEKLENNKILSPKKESQKELMEVLVGFNETIESAAKELAPHRICSFVYELSNAFNKFYHDTKILACEDKEEKDSYISLLTLTKSVLEKSIELLGFTAPDRM